MDPWISHIANSVSADPGAVRLAIGHVFGFLLKRYPNGEADEVIDMIPGARDVIADAATSVPPKRSLASRALGSMGGLIGGQKGGTLELTSHLLALGFTNDQLKRLTHEIFGGAALIAGREKVQRLTDPIPGLSGFLWPDANGRR
ncbi:MAG: DUF2267 domain-containing protein [Alphaproteobacteria bacterium]|nr:DUF2267 domain-containing protein [Alphaproteobacteria bacterium]